MGGAVRDSLLGRVSRDLDVAVSADANSVGRDLASHLGGRLVPLDRARNIVRLVVPGSPDGPAFVDLNDIPSGIMEDLSRRDFALDAMAVPLADAAGCRSREKLIDPFGGLSDLRAGVIRAVAPSVFQADPGRLMRAPRLAAQLRFEISEDTSHQIRRQAHLVSKVAPERTRDELLKLLAAPSVTTSLRRLDELGLLDLVIPELAAARGVVQPKEHYWDVFDHLVETVGQVERIVEGDRDDEDFVAESVRAFDSMSGHFAEEASDGHTRLTLLKLAGLLHDVAKPATRTVESSGRIRFFGHQSEGAEMAEGIMRRLRFSNRGTELVRLMVEHHLRPGQMAQGGELPSGRAIYRYFRDTGDVAVDTLYLNIADFLAARGPRLRREEWLEYCRLISHIMSEGRERKAPESLPKLIDGHDIMKAYSLSPGPDVGFLLGVAKEAQANGEVTTKEEALDFIKANFQSGGGGA